jgi:hypothetical protein
MSEKQGLTLAFLISTVGGLIVLVFSLINLVWFGSNVPSWGGLGDYMRSMMGGYHNFMGTYSTSTGFFTAVSIASFVCGVIVLMSSLVLRIHPQEHVLWGVTIVVFSAISFVGMGGYFVGGVFGIIGGALALTYKPIT